MNPELRIKVAESLGWTCDKDGYWQDKHGDSLINGLLPAFDTSLDACHEFEKDAPDEYWRELHNEVLGFYPNSREINNWIAVCKATPEQRCRAWLKMKGVDV